MSRLVMTKIDLNSDKFIPRDVLKSWMTTSSRYRRSQIQSRGVEVGLSFRQHCCFIHGCTTCPFLCSWYASHMVYVPPSRSRPAFASATSSCSLRILCELPSGVPARQTDDYEIPQWRHGRGALATQTNLVRKNGASRRWWLSSTVTTQKSRGPLSQSWRKPPRTSAACDIWWVDIIKLIFPEYNIVLRHHSRQAETVVASRCIPILTFQYHLLAVRCPKRVFFG